MSAALAPGFADPVLAGQAVFRAVMMALARPGIIRDLPVDLPPPPRPLTPELAGVALALADPDAALWLDVPLAASPEVATYLRFHTGARLVADPAEAAFALVGAPGALPPLSSFALGTDEYPDRSTTVAIAVPHLEGGAPITLSGPGIRGRITVAPPSLPADFAAALRANRALFPRGVDCLLVAPGGVLGIPRSASAIEAA